MVMLCLVLASYYVPFSQAQDKTAAPAAAPATAPASTGGITLSVDKTALSNGGEVTVTGKTQPGKPVYLEVWNDNKVSAVFFDDKPNKEGVRPYKLYLTEGLPAFYQIYAPASTKEVFEKFKKMGAKYPYSDALKEMGADVAFSVPAKMPIEAFQTSLMASIIGSRGDKLPALDPQENKRRAMQLTKARFRSPGKMISPTVDVKPDGSFTAKVKIIEGSAPGKYFIQAFSDKDLKSAPATLENSISFPVMYLSNGGTSLNILWPFLLTLGIGVFGVLMGAGGGFILNPILVSIWPLPHNIVAGTVMPTVLFSQGSGIYNYSKIKFISWKLGVTMGLAMLLGGFIGPKLTELITLDQFKSVFGWILLVLAALMFWQTTPGYLDKNKKEQAILKEFKKRAEEAAKAKG
uniref:Probable membrane transporter protein n=1 Tax=Fundidesulfovibrio putealis TaxID=270496 RepID=A0A7C4AGN4_9BACT